MKGKNMSNNRFKLISEVHLFLIKEGKVLLLRRFNTGYEDGNYHIIAGHKEADEEVKRAMIREAQEEAGINIQLNDLRVVHVMHRRVLDERVSFFLTTKKWSGEIINKEPRKCDNLSWFDLNNLPDNIVPYIKKGLDCYSKGVFYSSFGWGVNNE